MKQMTIKEIAAAWKEYKCHYVKRSTMAAYVLTLEKHVLPSFGDSCTLREQDVQAFVWKKLDEGLAAKTVRDILVVLKMVMRYGVKNEWMNHYEWDIKYPALSAPQGIGGALGLQPYKNIGIHTGTFLLCRARRLHQPLHGVAHRGDMRPEMG